MILAWLHRLRHWLWAPLFDLTGIVADGVLRNDDQLRAMQIRLERLEGLSLIRGEALARIEARLTTPTITTTHPAKVWDCGHEHTSGAKDREGVARCLGCHEEGYRA